MLESLGISAGDVEKPFSKLTKDEFIAQNAKRFTDMGYPAPRADLAENAWRNHCKMYGKDAGVIGKGGQGIIRADRDIGFHFSQNFGTSRFFPEF